MSMKKHNCCGDDLSCELEAELPDNYIDQLYAMYVKDCEEKGQSPLQKQEWIASLAP